MVSYVFSFTFSLLIFSQLALANMASTRAQQVQAAKTLASAILQATQTVIQSNPSLFNQSFEDMAQPLNETITELIRVFPNFQHKYRTEHTKGPYWCKPTRRAYVWPWGQNIQLCDSAFTLSKLGLAQVLIHEGLHKVVGSNETYITFLDHAIMILAGQRPISSEGETAFNSRNRYRAFLRRAFRNFSGASDLKSLTSAITLSLNDFLQKKLLNNSTLMFEQEAQGEDITCALHIKNVSHQPQKMYAYYISEQTNESVIHFSTNGDSWLKCYSKGVLPIRLEDIQNALGQNILELDPNRLNL